MMLSLTINATAEPWKRHTIDRSSKGADGVRLMDVNGDGLPDPVYNTQNAVPNWHTNCVYLNTGCEDTVLNWLLI